MGGPCGERGARIARCYRLSVESSCGKRIFHKELRLALDTAEEKPEGTIFIIPIRLDICDVPVRLSQYQYVDFFGDNLKKERAYQYLLASLKLRAAGLEIEIP